MSELMWNKEAKKVHEFDVISSLAAELVYPHHSETV